MTAEDSIPELKYHETMHSIFIINHMVASALDEDEVIRSNPEWFDTYLKAQGIMWELYQEIGKHRFEKFE